MRGYVYRGPWYELRLVASKVQKQSSIGKFMLGIAFLAPILAIFSSGAGPVVLGLILLPSPLVWCVRAAKRSEKEGKPFRFGHWIEAGVAATLLGFLQIAFTFFAIVVSSSLFNALFDPGPLDENSSLSYILIWPTIIGGYVGYFGFHLLLFDWYYRYLIEETSIRELCSNSPGTMNVDEVIEQKLVAAHAQNETGDPQCSESPAIE